MFSSGLITFRETLEAVLVVGIVLTFLTKTHQDLFKKYVWQGIAAGIALSITLALGVELFFGGLTGAAEEIFEGVLMFITAGFLTWMILWVHKQKDVAKKLKEKVAMHAEKGYGFGIFVLVASSIFREGTETVLYLKASSLTGAENQLTGALLGIGIALALGYVLFTWALRINLSTVFTITNVFLLLFGAGMVAHGVHEFQEAGLLPIFAIDPVINISHILGNDSLLGGLLRTVFGYTSKPTVVELLAYALYIGGIIWLQKISDKMLLKKSSK